MTQVKVAVIGAGSFVFGPSVLTQALQEHHLPGLELALMDVDAEVLAGMAGVGRRMAQEAGIGNVITTHSTLASALEGADFVICSAARQMQKRHAMDLAIINELLPGHQITEFGGIAGISYTLRQIALIQDIAREMRLHCPEAWLLNVANPLPRVCQAAHEEGIQTTGFCSVSASVVALLWKLFEGENLPFPWSPAEAKYAITLGGLNHLCWLLELRDKQTGEDLMPALRQKLANGETAGNPRCEAITRETGYLLLPNDDHTADFLVPDVRYPRPYHEPYHGGAEERTRRLQLLSEIGTGLQSYDELLAHPSWERPLDFVAAMAYGKTASFHTLSLINEGNVSNLPANVFAETGCTVADGKVTPHKVTLPKMILPYCSDAAQLSDTLVRAARTHSRALVHEAVQLDPTIGDKAAGIRAIDACLTAHVDVISDYA